MQITSYIRTWPLGSTREQMAEHKYWKAQDVKGEYLTDLIISFARINMDDWSIYIPDVDLPDSHFKNFWDEYDAIKKRTPELKMHLSVGGWDADGFSQMASSKESRTIFIKNLMDIAIEKGFEGVDIDWEFPVLPSSTFEIGIKTSKDDGKNYFLLMSELHDKLAEYEKASGKHIALSSAVPSLPWYTAQLDMKELAKYVDSIKLMSYDLYGPWNSQTGHHAGLYQNPANKDPDGWSIDQAVKLFEEAGMPREKIIVGAAFYGRAWKGVKDNGTHGLFQKYEESAYLDGISWPDLQKFLQPGSGFTRYWDDAAKVPYLYNGDLFITYVDEKALQELGRYAKENNLGGVMIWEYGHNMDCTLLKALNESIK